VTNIEEALVRIRKVSKPKSELGPFAILAWGAQSHVVELLESVFYLAFKGKTGAGKGTSLESACLIASNAVLLSVTTEAFLSTVLDEGRAVGIPEADKLVDRNPIVGKMLRDGYRRGAVAGLKVPRATGSGWDTTERSLFGPKAFDFHLSLDGHLLGRTIVVEMEPDESVDRALDAEKKARHLAPVRAWLALEAERVLHGWSKERVDALWDSAQFREEVGALGGKNGRDHVIGANLLLVCRVFGWEDYEAEIPRLIADRRPVQDSSDEAEVLDLLSEIVGSSITPETRVATSTLHEQVNEARGRLRLGSMSRKALGGVLTDLGFRKGVDWVRETSGGLRGQWVLRPFSVLTHLAHLTQSTNSGGSPPIADRLTVANVSDAPRAPHVAPAGLPGRPLADMCCSQGRDLIRLKKGVFIHADDLQTCYHPKSPDSPALPFGGGAGTTLHAIDTASSRPPREAA